MDGLEFNFIFFLLLNRLGFHLFQKRLLSLWRLFCSKGKGFIYLFINKLTVRVCVCVCVQVETSNGRVVPGSFDASTRCPDEIIRRIRLGASFGPGPPRLLDTYQTQTDQFLIPPFSW